jgi:hypothetical protein
MGVTYEVISTKRPGAASGKTSQGKEDSEDCNTHKESVEIYSDATNCAGLRHSAWRLPGVLAQRDTLHSMDAGFGIDGFGPTRANAANPYSNCQNTLPSKADPSYTRTMLTKA